METESRTHSRRWLLTRLGAFAAAELIYDITRPINPACAQEPISSTDSDRYKQIINGLKDRFRIGHNNSSHCAWQDVKVVPDPSWSPEQRREFVNAYQEIIAPSWRQAYPGTQPDRCRLPIRQITPEVDIILLENPDPHIQEQAREELDFAVLYSGGPLEPGAYLRPGHIQSLPEEAWHYLRNDPRDNFPDPQPDEAVAAACKALEFAQTGSAPPSTYRECLQRLSSTPSSSIEVLE